MSGLPDTTGGFDGDAQASVACTFQKQCTIHIPHHGSYQAKVTVNFKEPLATSTKLACVDVNVSQQEQREEGSCGDDSDLVTLNSFNGPAEATPSSRTWEAVLARHVGRLFIQKSGPNSTLRLLLPLVTGYLICSDVIRQRLCSMEHLPEISTFVKADQGFDAFSLEKARQATCGDIFKYAIASVEYMHAGGCDETAVEKSLMNRMSFPWYTHEPPVGKTLVMIGHRRPAALERLFSAARGLNISLVVLVPEGSDMEPLRPHCKLVLAANLTLDDNFGGRVMAHVRNLSFPVDGLLALDDPYIPEVARAAQSLGLPFQPVDPLSTAMDKGKLRRLAAEDCFVTVVREAQQLERDLSLHPHRFRYPLIIKPCHGFGSYGVWKVTNENELRIACSRAWTEQNQTELVIERYIAGPEVDANLVLYDDQLLFFEVVDDFPKLADVAAAGLEGDFAETSMFYPSGLPDDEIAVIKAQVGNLLKGLGLTTGIFHVEARVKGSSMRYKPQSALAVHELSFDLEAADRESASAFVLEINPRPPGFGGIWSTILTSGVDYAQLSVLRALGDLPRMGPLARGFEHGEVWCHLVLIPVPSGGGIFECDDLLGDLYGRRPDLKKFVGRADCLFRKGELLPDPGKGVVFHVAYFCVLSWSSRREALEVGDMIKREVRIVVRPAPG